MMRQLTFAALAALSVAAAAEPRAQPGSRPVITVAKTNPSRQIDSDQLASVPGARIDLYKTSGLLPLGTTNASGALAFDTSLLSGKPKIDVRLERCAEDVHLGLFPDGETVASTVKKCSDGCKCRWEDAAFTWGDSYNVNIDQFGGGLPISQPVLYGLLGGAGTIAALTFANGDTTPGISNPPTTTTTTSVPGTGPAFPAIVGAYTLTGIVTQRGNCNFNNFTAVFTIEGTPEQTRAQLVEAILRNVQGTSTLQGNVWNFSLTGTGTIPGLGPYSETVVGQTNGQTMTATDTLGLPCGSVSSALSGPKREGM